MSKEPKTETTPTVKVEVTAAPATHHGPEQDAQQAKEGRQQVEATKAAANTALEEAGLVPGVTPITGYEHERAQLGAEVPESK